MLEILFVEQPRERLDQNVAAQERVENAATTRVDLTFVLEIADLVAQDAYLGVQIGFDARSSRSHPREKENIVKFSSSFFLFLFCLGQSFPNELN